MKTQLAAPVDVKELYAPSAAHPTMVEVPAFKFLMVDGKGDPNEAKDFQDAIGALFGLSYGVHFALKKAGIESRVRPLEALWWADGKRDFMEIGQGLWRWTAMMLQPDEITPALLEKVRIEAERKKPNPMLAKARLETFDEGLAAQVMHVGPYSAEKPTIERLRAFIAEQGYRPRGKHHEIYIGDPRRAAPEKLKTVVRQPVAR
jgi:hypothetical protein